MSSSSGSNINVSKWYLNVTVTDFKVKMPLIVTEGNENQVLLLMISNIGVSGIIGDITGFKGKFNMFQLKFAVDGEESNSEIRMNCCEVKEGGIEIISETENLDDNRKVIKSYKFELLMCFSIEHLFLYNISFKLRG